MQNVGTHISDLNTFFVNFNTPSVDVNEEGKLKTMTASDTNFIREKLNALFPNANCVEVIYTRNTDHLLFGVYVNPTIIPERMIEVLFGDNPMKIERYTVEIDSKLFDQGLDSMEIVAILLREVAGMVCDENPIWNFRGCMDHYMAATDDVLSITFSANAVQLMTFAIKDSLHKLTSCLYPEAEFENEFIKENNLDVPLGNALKKILSSSFGLFDTVRHPKLIILEWVLSIYQDLKHHYPSAIHTLKEAKNTTGSKLQNMEIDKVIRALNYVSADLIQLEATTLITEAKRGGLFDNMKQNGLRAIEDDLYEFRVRAKNSETEDDAMYTLRQINTRLNIIEEYLYTNETQLRPDEIERWRSCAAKYRELREEISRKTISHKKQYGLWFDYDKI